MLNQYSYKHMKLPELRFLCKRAKLKYTGLKKKQLFDILNEYIAVKKIQKRFRSYFYKNATDHITLEPVKYPCFVYRTKSGKCYFYEYDTIIKYIMKSGNTNDPMTRTPYTDDQLNRLDKMAKYHFPEKKYSSTLKIKQNKVYAKRIYNRENEILSYEMRLDELKTSLFVVIESGLCFVYTEPIIIGNYQYQSIYAYTLAILHEIKLIFRNLQSIDTFSSSIFKKTIIEDLEKNSNLYTLLHKFFLEM